MTPLPLVLALVASTPQSPSLPGSPAPSGADVRLVRSPLAGKSHLLGDFDAEAAPRRGTLIAATDEVPDHTVDLLDARNRNQSEVHISPLIPAIGGAALAAAGAVCWFMAFGIENNLRSGNPTFANGAELDQEVLRGRTLERVGWGLGIAGVAVLAIAAASQFLGGLGAAPSMDSAGPNFTFIPVPGGAITAVVGTLPN